MKILVSDPLAEAGLEILRKEKNFQVDVKTKLSPDELKKIIKDYDGLIIRSGTKVTKEIIDAADNLKIIGRAGVGLDNVDLEEATKRGIIVMNTPGGNTISTAEQTISLILSLARNIPQAYVSLLEKKWDRKKYTGTQLYGKVLGIIGMGRIGTEVAKRMLSFGMTVIASDPFISVEKAEKIGVQLVELKDLFKQADFITVHIPLTEETKHLIGKKSFAIMKKGVRIINCARGGIVDEKALLEAIKEKKVAGAALDVYEKEPPTDNPLLELTEVVVSPHLGASTQEAQIGVAVEIAQQIVDAFKDNIRNAANLPSLEPEVLKAIKPYLVLSEKLGLLQAQLADGRINEVKVRYSGDVLEYDVAPLTVALIKGLLTPLFKDSINFVNAPFIAQERGIKVIESKSSLTEDFTNLISLELETDKGKNLISGTIFGKNDPRVVRINHYHVDAVPSGYMLVCFHTDRPGIIGNIGVVLGKNKVNIANMTLGRIKRGEEAVTVLNVDGGVSKEVLTEIKNLRNIRDVKLVKL